MGWTDIFVLLFVTVGPVKAALLFIGLTKTADAKLKRAIAIRTVLVSTVICIIFAVIGAGILAGLKVSTEALLIAGGIILLLFALDLILADEKAPEQNDAPPPAPTLDIATFPLAVPLMASPQGLVAIVAIEGTLQSTGQGIVFACLILLMMAINLGVMLAAEKIFSKIPPAILKIFLRIVGLLLCALAVQLVIYGLDGLGLIPSPDVELNSPA
ncbi:MarC family protein [Maritimibacter alkaliphilus]|uniref:MarC family protein n=1 Tax=Maritimibacter alkaliphilus TaxID=404236 RepID=UPI001C985CA3|nr:MarC family protein [Maritimibacter alkaliphilus]MBY6092847.1 NAAT family transporter [Maritimibacter alkaliphilus]